MDWSNMPQEILDLILSNLFFEDRHNFSLVCRLWNESVVASYRHSPCLLLNHSWKVFQHNTFFSTNLLKLDEHASILCSNHGWLLMHYKTSSPFCSDLFFLDPFNNQRIDVPVDPLRLYITISFVHPPTSPDCFIVGIHHVEELPVELGVIRLGEDTWQYTLTEHISNRVKFQPSHACPILYDGKLFFVDVRGNIATFDPEDENTAWSGFIYTKCLQKRCHRKDIIEHYLVKPKGEDALFGVFVRDNSRAKGEDRNSRKVHVYNWVINYWEPVDDLGDRVFYVSKGSTFGYRTDDKRLANKIFFTKFCGDKIVFYSLDTKKYHCFEGEYSSENSFATCDYDSWIMPAPTPQQVLTWYPQEPPRQVSTWCPQEPPRQVSSPQELPGEVLTRCPQEEEDSMYLDLIF